jgi:ABC-type Fe3+ transport system substrate-binding protein
VRAVEEMLTERGYNLENPVAVEGEDPDLVRDFLAAREIARAAETTEVEREDIETALEDLAEIHDYITEDRAPP